MPIPKNSMSHLPYGRTQGPPLRSAPLPPLQTVGEFAFRMGRFAGRPADRHEPQAGQARGPRPTTPPPPVPTFRRDLALPRRATIKALPTRPSRPRPYGRLGGVSLDGGFVLLVGGLNSGSSGGRCRGVCGGGFEVGVEGVGDGDEATYKCSRGCILK